MAVDVDCVRECTDTKAETVLWVVIASLTAIALQVLAIASLRKKRRQ
jgi:hypothetical protein